MQAKPDRAAADTALYQAKRGGRNRVQAAEEQPLSLEQGRRAAITKAGAATPSIAVRSTVTMTAQNAR